MTPPTDCLNSRTSLGRNATPLPVIASAYKVLGGVIGLDPSSDEVINRTVQAKRVFTASEDGFAKPWVADTLWLNPPGKTMSQGKTITASQWYQKLYHAWMRGNVKTALALVYRGGSLGSLGLDIMSLPICLTAAGARSSCVNGSGRLSFDEIDESGNRVTASKNTQSSAIVLFSIDEEIRRRFKAEFSRYGVVKL